MGILFKLRRGDFTLLTQEHVNIIDLYSWCYVILILLQVFQSKIKEFNVFVYRALLAIIMNIILPHAEPANVPVHDVLKNLINADYIRKMGVGITALLRFLNEQTIPNELCTHYKVRVFLDLIQTCDTADEIFARFNSSVSDAAFEEKQRVFDAESAELLVIEEGGARRRRTHNKKHRPKKNKRTKRGTRRTR